MKRLAGLIIILAVLILGGYYGMGVVTEHTVRKDIEIINQSNGLFAQIEHYNRGWFKSDAQIKWRLHLPEHIVKDDQGNARTVAAQDYELQMPVLIHHGPIIFGKKGTHFGMGYAETVLLFPKQYNEKFDELFSKESMKPKMDLSIFVNYLNKSTLELSFPSFTLVSKDGKAHFNWMGMNSTTKLTSDLHKIEGDVVIDGLKMTKDDAEVNLGKVLTDFNLHQTPAGLYLGNANFSLPALNVVVKDKKLLELSDFTLNSDSDIEQNLFSTHFNASLKALKAHESTYGPFNLELSLRNLDADVLAEINKQASALQNGSEAERQKALLAILPQVPKLFNKGAEFEVSQMSMTVPEGTIDGSLLVSLPKGENANPFELIQKIHGTAKVTMPKVLVKQLLQQSLMQQMSKQPELQQALIQQMQSAQPQEASAAPPSTEQLAGMQADKQLASMEQNGLMIAKDSNYVVDVSLDKGRFVVNGKPFDPSMLK